MADFRKISDMVKYELENDPKTRDDDNYLVARVYADFYGLTDESFVSVMTYRAEMRLPSMESIGRCRRKLQEEMPLVYGASGKARSIRRAEELTYMREFGG